VVTKFVNLINNSKLKINGVNNTKYYLLNQLEKGQSFKINLIKNPILVTKKYQTNLYKKYHILEKYKIEKIDNIKKRVAYPVKAINKFLLENPSFIKENFLKKYNFFQKNLKNVLYNENLIDEIVVLNLILMIHIIKL
jgi:lipopolysaccharide biosynthesis protein